MRPKEQLLRERAAWARALQQIAAEHGEKSPVYKLLGTIAWGRYDGEPCPSDDKDNVATGLAFLQGVRYAAINACELMGLHKAEQDFRCIHDRMRRNESPEPRPKGAR